MFASYCGLTWPYVRLPTSVHPSVRPSRPVRFPCAYKAKFNSFVSTTTFALPFYEKIKKDRDEKIHCRHWWGPRNAVTKDAHIHIAFRGKANFKCHQDVQILLIVVSHFAMQTSDSKTVEYERVSLVTRKDISRQYWLAATRLPTATIWDTKGSDFI